MKKRLFVASTLPTHFTSEFKSYQPKLNLPNLRWMKEEDYHLTLAFLGYIDETQVEIIKQELAKIAKATDSFQLDYEGIIFAPPNISPWMVWAKFAYSEPYNLLVDQTFRALESYTTEQSRPDKIPHITLARFEKGGLSKDQAPPQLNLKETSFTLRRLTLFQSLPLKSGSVYTNLAEFDLK